MTARQQSVARQAVKVVAITGGKGGVGKTSVATNLGVALAARGRRVLLLDADFGLANVDVLLGLRAGQNLAHVLRGECGLEDVILTGPRGLRVVPSASGLGRMAALGPAEQAGLIHAFSALADGLDLLLIDTAAGVADTVTTFSRAAHHVLVVVCDEPAAITDAYALIKVLSREHGIDRFQVLASQVRSAGDGRELFRRFQQVCGRFLSVSLEYAGAIPYDDYLKRAIQHQQAVVEAYPSCLAAQAFKNLAGRADKWATPGGARGHLEFFVERLVAAPRAERTLQ